VVRPLASVVVNVNGVGTPALGVPGGGWPTTPPPGGNVCLNVNESRQ
jgi:hypothetical protein